LDKNSQDILNESEHKGRKESKKSSTAIETEEREISLTTPQHQDEPSKKSEIDLSQASERSSASNEVTPERKEEKQKPEKDDSRISVISPTDAVFETQTQPQKVAVHEKRIKGDTSEKKRLNSSKPKPRKLPKGGMRQKRPTREKTLSTKTTSQSPKLAPQPVTMSKGVAYLHGNMIKLIGGVKLHPGDEIKIRDKEFVLKTGRKKKTWIYMSAVLLFIIAVIFFSPLLESRNNGKLIGVVTEEKTRTFVPGAKIYLKEAGKTVKSNHLGFFMFESLPPGPYALKVSSKGYEAKSENVTIERDQAITLYVDLTPLVTGKLSSDSLTQVSSPKRSGRKTSSSGKSATGSDYGAVKIESNVSDPTILIDNRLAGMGNKVYQQIKPGKHVIAVTKQGYYDWAQEVKIKSGKTLNLNITLSEDKTQDPDLQTWKDFIALGNTQLSSNDFTSALNSYNQALALKPDSPDAFLKRGYTYMQMGDRLKASADFEKSAELFINEHDYQKAAVSYTNLISLNDRDKDSYLNRGICYLKLGEYRKSIQDLKKTVELDSDLFSGYLNLGEAYYKAGEYKLSIESYKRAQKLNSKSQPVFVGLTKAYFAKGDKSKAKKSYKKFEKLSTYIYQEKLKHDPEWRKVLEGIGVESQPKL